MVQPSDVLMVRLSLSAKAFVTVQEVCSTPESCKEAIRSWGLSSMSGSDHVERASKDTLSSKRRADVA